MSHLLNRDHNPPPFEGFFGDHFGPFSLIKNLLNQKNVLVTFKKIGFVTFWQSLPSKTMCKKSQHSIKVISRKLVNRIKHISQKNYLKFIVPWFSSVSSGKKTAAVMVREVLPQYLWICIRLRPSNSKRFMICDS